MTAVLRRRTRIRPRLWLAAGLLALSTVAAGAVPAAAQAHGHGGCDGHGRRGYECAQAGDLVDVRLKDLHPTQSVLGFDEVYYKLGRYGSGKDEANGDLNTRFDDWCETNGQGAAASAPPGARLDDPASFTCEIPLGQETEESKAEMKTVVIGPHGSLYLTDGHHTLTSFLESPDGGPRMHIRLRVTGNLSGLGTKAFWQKMRENRWVWLRDAEDRPIDVRDLPGKLGLDRFDDDVWRGVVYFTRGIGYEQIPGQAPEFQEFYWGSWLRRHIDLKVYDLSDFDDYLRLVKDASQAMTALSPDDVVADGLTAGQLGKLDAWNDGKPASKGEYAKLAKPITDAKPGKLAYAVAYRASL